MNGISLPRITIKILSLSLPLLPSSFSFSLFLFFFNIYFYLFIWLHRVLVVACGIQFPNEDQTQGPSIESSRVLAAGPPGEPLSLFLFLSRVLPLQSRH